MFIDREADLADLNDRWGLRPQLYLLWGRRRVGKSALIREFARGREAIIYQAVTGTVGDQLGLLTRRILAWRADPILEAAPLANWDQAFAYLEGIGRQRKAESTPLLIVFDEFQYVADPPSCLISIDFAVSEDGNVSEYESLDQIEDTELPPTPVPTLTVAAPTPVPSSTPGLTGSPTVTSSSTPTQTPTGTPSVTATPPAVPLDLTCGTLLSRSIAAGGEIHTLAFSGSAGVVPGRCPIMSP